LQALAAGVPLLTLRGDRFSARIGASALVHAGLGDTLATDVDDYVERAARLCEDRAWAGQWRRRTLAAFAPAASQARFEAYVHSLEDLYLGVFAKASGRF
jgi:predicted O-linked N-acetylglucosamine transferase (SPINDLY family)